MAILELPDHFFKMFRNYDLTTTRLFPREGLKLVTWWSPSHIPKMVVKWIIWKLPNYSFNMELEGGLLLKCQRGVCQTI